VGAVDETHPPPAAAPGGFDDEEGRRGGVRSQETGDGFEGGDLDGRHHAQTLLHPDSHPAMRALADVGNLCLAGTGPGTDTIAEEAAAKGLVIR